MHHFPLGRRKPGDRLKHVYLQSILESSSCTRLFFANLSTLCISQECGQECGRCGQYITTTLCVEMSLLHCVCDDMYMYYVPIMFVYMCTCNYKA